MFFSEYLVIIRDSKQYLDECINTLEQIRTAEALPHGVRYDVQKSKGTRKPKDLSDYAVKYDKALRRYYRAGSKYCSQYERARDALDSFMERGVITPEEERVIKYRYLLAFKWEKVSECMELTHERCNQLKNKALEKLDASGDFVQSV